MSDKVKVSNNDKDNWDKFNIVIDFFSKIILVSIPIAITIGANNISQSLKRGQLVESLIDDLSLTKARRDVAFIALDDALDEKKKCILWFCKNDTKDDPVIEIGYVLIKNKFEEILKSSKSEELSNKEDWVAEQVRDVETILKIISKRSSEGQYQKQLIETLESLQRLVISSDSESLSKDKDIKKIRSIRSKILEPISEEVIKQTPSLSGIRIVYIQYDGSDIRAKVFQKYLNNDGVVAPGLEKIKGITKNEIRYANQEDYDIALKLEDRLEAIEKEKCQDESFKLELIDLSDSGYTVPSGQFEIWLKADFKCEINQLIKDLESNVSKVRHAARSRLASLYEHTPKEVENALVSSIKSKGKNYRIELGVLVVLGKVKNGWNPEGEIKTQFEELKQSPNMTDETFKYWYHEANQNKKTNNGT